MSEQQLCSDVPTVHSNNLIICYLQSGGQRRCMGLMGPTASPCRFIPRHADELELDVDDPLYVEEEEDDYWYRGYNMRTGEKGIFPAFYAHEVIGHTKELMGKLGDCSLPSSLVTNAMFCVCAGTFHLYTNGSQA